MRVEPDDDLYAFEPLKVTKGDGNKEALFFARYRAWAYFSGLTLLLLGGAWQAGAGPLGYVAALLWGAGLSAALLRVLDHNRPFLALARAAAVDLTDWWRRPRKQSPLTLTPRRL